jgi:hypothetical protein
VPLHTAKILGMRQSRRPAFSTTVRGWRVGSDRIPRLGAWSTIKIMRATCATRGPLMPLQNRVSPFGDIVAISQRGIFTGNRGIIHDPAGR